MISNWLICWNASPTCKMVCTTYVLSDFGSLQNKTWEKVSILSLYPICVAYTVWLRISANIFISGFKSNSETDSTKTSHMQNIRNLRVWTAHVLKYLADSGSQWVEELGNTWGKNIYQRLITYSASGIRGLPQENGKNLSPPVQCCTERFSFNATSIGLVSGTR